jgi:MFS family permease
VLEGARPDGTVTVSRPPVRERALFITLLATNALTLIAATAAAPTLPELTRVFGGTSRTDRLVPLVLTLTPLAIACAAPLAGALIDRIGRRPVLAFGALLFALAGSSAVFAPSLGWLLATRALVGVAAACTMTGTTTVITDAFDGAERARVLALQAAIVGVIGTTVIILSGVLVSVDWRAPFLLYLVGLPAAYLVLRFVPERSTSSPVTSSPVASVPMPPVAARGAVDRAAARERKLRGPHGPMPPLVAIMYLGMLGLQITNFLVAVHLPFELEARFAAGGAAAGVAVGLGTLAYAGGALFSVPLSQRTAVPGVIAVASAFLAVGHWGLTSPVLTMALASNLLLGLGFGLIVPNLIAWLAVIVPVRLRGRVFGGMTASLFLGQFLSPFVWAPVVAEIGRSDAFRLAGWLFAFTAGAALMSAWRARRYGVRSPG